MKLLTKTQAKELYEVVLRLHNIGAKLEFFVRVPSMFNKGDLVSMTVVGNTIVLSSKDLAERYFKWCEFEGAYEL